MAQSNTLPITIAATVSALVVAIAAYLFFSVQVSANDDEYDVRITELENQFSTLQTNFESCTDALSDCRKTIQDCQGDTSLELFDENGDAVEVTTEDETTLDDVTIDEADSAYEGWSTYTDTKYGLTWHYPSDWEVKEQVYDADENRVVEKGGFCLLFQSTNTFMTVCYRDKNDSSMITWFRTGIGYSEISTKTVSLDIAGAKVTEKTYHGEGTNKTDIFFGKNQTDAADEPNVGHRIAVGDYIMTIMASSRTYPTVSTTGISDTDEDILDNILESLAL
ncbi:MAG: hypothetical protein ABIG66_01685 [Candidatus Kerfeldbacteria bacterium]